MRIFFVVDVGPVSSSLKMTLSLRFLAALSLCTIFFFFWLIVYQIFVAEHNPILALSLLNCTLCLCLFFFNLNFQKSICFCSWCQKSTLGGIFLGYTVEHCTAFTKNEARADNPTCPLFPVGTPCHWLCYLKID